MTTSKSDAGDYMPASNLAISYQPLGSLTPDPGNARTHSKRQIRQIADSIDEFGFNNPIIVDCNNTVIAGHGRLEAARVRGMEKVPTIRLEHRFALIS